MASIKKIRKKIIFGRVFLQSCNDRQNLLDTVVLVNWYYFGLKGGDEI